MGDHCEAKEENTASHNPIIGNYMR